MIILLLAVVVIWTAALFMIALFAGNWLALALAAIPVALIWVIIRARMEVTR